MLEYEGSVPMVFHWAQELLGYHFSIVHWINKIMIDVNSLTASSQYCIIASILYSTDKPRRPKSYKESVFIRYNIVKLTLYISQKSLKPMSVTTSTIKNNKNRKLSQKQIFQWNNNFNDRSYPSPLFHLFSDIQNIA